MNQELQELITEYNNKIKEINTQVCKSLDDSLDRIFDEWPEHFPIPVNVASDTGGINQYKTDLTKRLKKSQAILSNRINKVTYDELNLHSPFENDRPFETNRVDSHLDKYPDSYLKAIKEESKNLYDSLKKSGLLYEEDKTKLTEPFILSFFLMNQQCKEHIKSIFDLESTIKSLFSKEKKSEYKEELKKAKSAWQKDE
ncbi:hypothetical protein NRL14_17735 [Pseudoalteromonas sp. 20-92]|uniref:hypothetical protein n=1 Tax=Pseudoalteromonas sp. 20-92 TaxID=2969394 RepID=UPI0027B3B40A|nr:hypothetical protein [Pseudoalteromonas sp. 20-92]MDQ2045550.1 hypothetical protein [Pseudoalteromonas sp. 20-92]